MIRKIINIDEDKCNGCGVCVNACHEGAISIVDGKAKLLRDDYCDGLGDCLPTCPTGAITFTEREAAAYNEKAVLANKKNNQKKDLQNGCVGRQIKQINRVYQTVRLSESSVLTSQLMQWPVQIKLVPINAPYFNGAKLLIAADCTAYAYAKMHDEFMVGKITLIGCPKLDAADYNEKLMQIIANNNIKSVTVVRMEVPCCAGIEAAAMNALKNSGKFLPWNVVTISIDGRIIDV